jgi:serine/threonine protein kinase
MPLLIDSQSELIPGYRLIERLGQGGFGEVWKAEAPGGLLKAVKIIRGSLSTSNNHDAVHLNQELKSLQRVKAIRHPYILSLERFDIIDGRLIIVSELADKTLHDRFLACRDQGLPGIPRPELLRYLEEAAEALDLMNAQFNLQHLDIKPQNLFLVYNHVKVGDFGLVKDLEGMFAQITSGVTAVYAAPETFEGVASRFCDQYSLAIVFQQLLTGQLPYDGTTGRQLMLQHLTGVPNLALLSATDRPVVGRALAKKAEERYPSCLDFVRALQQPGVSAPPEAEVSAWATLTPINPADSPTAFLGGGTRRPSGEGSLATSPLGYSPFFNPVDSPMGESRTEKPLDVVIDYKPPPPPPERPETTGDGVLMPALVIGLGGLGREVLQEFRKSLRRRCPNETWPHIRLLHVDTNSEGYDHSMRAPDSLLSPQETLVTPFQRASFYLKRQRPREELGQWLPLNQLITVPRGQTSAEGWRALGRLAFVSCTTAIASRLRDELEACCGEVPLQDAAQRTSLGLRSSRPRVYVVTSLSGGTGSGMFLEMAWALRRELQQVGHPQAEVIGVLLVPAAKRTASPRGIANSYAALVELNHFARVAAATAFSKDGRGHAGTSGPDKPPFDRCVLLPLPAAADGPAALHERTTLAGDFLCRELTSRLGRSADEERAALRPQSTQGSAAGMTCLTFGAYWFSVPRRPLLENVAQHICDRLVRSWRIHDPRQLDEAITTWVTDQVHAAQLCPEPLAESLRQICANFLGQEVSALFDSLLARWSKGGSEDLRRNPNALPKALEELQQLLGPAQVEPSLDLPSPPAEALREASRVVVEKVDARLAEITLNALAEPHFRFACKEAAAQEQLGVALGEAARLHKRTSEQKSSQALNLLQQVYGIQASVQGGFFLPRTKARAAASIVQHLGQYLGTRWDAMMALALSRLFQDLQVNLYKYCRGLDCCHKRIEQFVKTFGAGAANDARVDLGLGRYLLPFGCRTLAEAVKRILDTLPPAEESALHGRVWNLIRATLRDNVHVCTAPVALFRDLRERIDHEVEKVAEDSLGRAHAAEVYLQQHAEEPDADADLAGAFDEAQPELASLSSGDGQGFCILAVPPGPEGERFRALVRHALPDVPMRAAASTDDIIFYREQPYLCLTDLPQLGPTAREIYQQVLATEQYSPHSRTDISAW